MNGNSDDDLEAASFAFDDPERIVALPFRLTGEELRFPLGHAVRKLLANPAAVTKDGIARSELVVDLLVEDGIELSEADRLELFGIPFTAIDARGPRCSAKVRRRFLLERKTELVRLQRESPEDTGYRREEAQADEELDTIRAFLVDPSGATTRSRIIATSASDIEAKAVRWLWRNYVPESKITDAYGDGDMGKSMVLLDLAARVSTGATMPDGSHSGPPGNVLIFAAEDDAADTIRPRLEAAGADLSRVRISDGTFRDGARQRYLALAEHLVELRAAFQEHRPRLTLFDPIMAFMGSVKTGVDSEVRAALGPLKNLAGEYGTAIISLRHINKSAGASANMRGTASTAFRNLARAGLVFGQHPDDESRRVMAPNKSNLGPRPQSMVFSIEAPKGQPVVRWHGPCDLTAADILGSERSASTAKGPKPGSKVEACARLIREWITEEGAIRAPEIEEKLAAEGFGSDTIKSAKKYAGVRSDRDAEGWFWRFDRS